MEKKVLLIDDDQELVAVVSQYMVNMGYKIRVTRNGLEAETMLITKGLRYDLIIMEAYLPYRSGDELIRKIRQIDTVPIIVISSLNLVKNKVDLLGVGADDYLCKPFDIDELAARAAAHIRRACVYTESMGKLCYKDLVLCPGEKAVYLKEQKIKFTHKEYQILELFIKNKKKVFTKENIFESIWGQKYYRDANIINTHINNIRRKLKEISPNEQYIETVWGIGYRLSVYED